MPARPMPLCAVLVGHDAFGVEAVAVVADLHADALDGVLAQLDGNRAAAAVLLDVAERLLQNAQERDPL